MWKASCRTCPFGYLLLVAYGLVFIAELVGDKSIYTVSSLTLRFRPFIVFGALVCAFAAKMFACCLARPGDCPAELAVD